MRFVFFVCPKYLLNTSLAWSYGPSMPMLIAHARTIVGVAPWFKFKYNVQISGTYRPQASDALLFNDTRESVTHARIVSALFLG